MITLTKLIGQTGVNLRANVYDGFYVRLTLLREKTKMHDDNYDGEDAGEHSKSAPIDDITLEELERELPGLSILSRFARNLENIPWFANLGEPLTPGARAIAQHYVDALGFPDADIAILVDWEDAADAAESQDWHSPAWESEELLRADLTGRALEVLSEEALKIGMTLIGEKITPPAKEAMEQASFIWDMEDEASQRLAIGAAVQAANNAALALIAANDPEFESEAHPLAAKFQLFEFGRWPVGIMGRSFNLF